MEKDSTVQKWGGVILWAIAWEIWNLSNYLPKVDHSENCNYVNHVLKAFCKNYMVICMLRRDVGCSWNKIEFVAKSQEQVIHLKWHRVFLWPNITLYRLTLIQLISVWVSKRGLDVALKTEQIFTAATRGSLNFDALLSAALIQCNGG